MRPQNEGRPFAAVLLLFSMFAFAFVFHAVTRPEATIAAHFDAQLSALARPITPQVPVIEEPQPPRAAATVVSPPGPVPMTHAAAPIEAAPSIDAALPIDAARPIDAAHASLVPTYLPAPIAAAPPEVSAVQRGAVTRSLTMSGAALRSAFKKAF